MAGSRFGGRADQRRVARAFEVLNCFKSGPSSLGLSEISRRVGLSTTIVYRLLRSLVDAGFLEQDERTSRYHLGVGFRAVPFLALVPLYLAWFGVDETFKVVLIASSAAVPIYTYSYLGVRNVDRKVVEAARGFGLRGGALVRRVVVPSALPSVLMGLRICLVLSMTALISAEGIGTEEGIGYLVLLARQYARTDYTVLCVVLYAALGIAFDIAIRLVERYSMP